MPSPDEPTAEQLYEEVKALHDRIAAADIQPDMVDFICMLQGWTLLLPTQTLRVIYGDKSYLITREC